MDDAVKLRIAARLNTLTDNNGNKDALFGQLIDDAESYCLSYTRRKTLPPGLVRTVGDLALIAYNRLGTEGEKARSEGGESYTFDNAPSQVLDILRAYRLARCGGHAYEIE